jgi:hypothetical protein
MSMKTLRTIQSVEWVRLRCNCFMLPGESPAPRLVACAPSVMALALR